MDDTLEDPAQGNRCRFYQSRSVRSNPRRPRRSIRCTPKRSGIHRASTLILMGLCRQEELAMSI